ncbi:MAG: DUF1015 family protein [Bacteroidota bacterium]|nr:DUF1015 family protein [Bacteroidota bacterium]
MISLRPFRAWRPVPDKAALVGSRSYVSYTPEQLAEKLDKDPYSFLHVIHPQEEVGSIALSREDRFQLTRNAFHRFCDQGIITRDAKPSIYIYEQHAHGNISRGIITGVSVQDYLNGAIKVHEQTLTAREQLFTDYLEATGINAEPVLLTTPPGNDWQDLLDPVCGQDPIYDFITNDGIHHRLWSSDDVKLREDLQLNFSQIPALYIADGHHRLASSARLAQQHQATDVDPESWCLAYIVPHNQLYIYNFDRVVDSLGDLSRNDLLDRLGKVGTLSPVRSGKTAPGTIAIRLAQEWFCLKLPETAENTDPAARLDAARLSQLVLGPMLGITDLRTDPRISFIPGIEGTKYLETLVDSGKAAAAFHLHPVSFSELRSVADTGGTMPPKSTYIEPKLRSGITVYSLEDV